VIAGSFANAVSGASELKEVQDESDHWWLPLCF